MKRTYLLNATVPLMASVLMLVACGGGSDNDSGSPTSFSLSVNTLTFKAGDGSPAGQCVAGMSATVFVYGGAGPYRLDNSFPEAMALSTNEVSDKGGSFSVTVTGICLNPGIITVIDKLDRQVVLKVINSAAS